MNDREKLIELINEGRRMCEDSDCENCTHNEDIFCTRSIIADHLISNGVTVQKWIPVSERLPEGWVPVLVFSKYGFCETAVYLGIEGKWRLSWNHDLLQSVTHWMPLPEPPKGCE